MNTAAEILEYYVMRNEAGVTMWLDADEKAWTTDFYNAAVFTSAKLADDIAKRQLGEGTFFIMCCMASDPGVEA